MIQFVELAPSMLPNNEPAGLMHSPASQTSAFCCLTQLIEVFKENKHSKNPGNSIFPVDCWSVCVFPFSQRANLPQPPLALGRCCLCNFLRLRACAFGVFSPLLCCWTTARTGSGCPKPSLVFADGQSPVTLISNDAPPLFQGL